MRQPPILMYHWFRKAGEPSQSRSPQLEITPELFRQQMESLAARGYHGVTVTEAMQPSAASSGRKRPIAITFDDGTLDFWDHARSILNDLGFSATLFVVTGYVGGESSWDLDLGEPARPLLDWEQLRTLHQEGFEIGSHTCGHRVLTDLSDAEAELELTGSRQAITEQLGEAPRSLAYPRGYFAARHKRMAAAAGYESACAVVLGLGDLARADPYALRRLTIKGNESMTRFRLRVAVSSWVRLAR